MKWCKLARALNEEGVKQADIKRKSGHKIRSVYVVLLDTASIESCFLVKSPHPLSRTPRYWLVVCVPAKWLYHSGGCDFIERQDDGEWSVM